MAWLTIWNTAEMSAWLAMMAASVATTNIGQKVPLGSDFQNMASYASGCAKRYEPCAPFHSREHVEASESKFPLGLVVATHKQTLKKKLAPVPR